MNELVRVFVTGGTFDKEYNERNGSLFFKDSHLRDMLKLARSLVDVEVRTLMMVDSLDMDDEDREVILSQCRKSPQNRIVITHGTDTMIDTARALVGIANKTSVLTGAMQPARFRHTDAVFNIASAMMAAQTLSAGVYIAMNGQVFDPHSSRKNVELNRFEKI